MLKTIDEKGCRKLHCWNFAPQRKGKKDMARLVRRVSKQLVRIIFLKSGKKE